MQRKRKLTHFANIQFRTRRSRDQLQFWVASAKNGDAGCWAL